MILGVTSGAFDNSLVLDDSAATGTFGTVTDTAVELIPSGCSGVTEGTLLLTLKALDLWWNLRWFCPCFEIDASGDAVGMAPIDSPAGVFSASFSTFESGFSDCTTGAAAGNELAGTASTVTVTVLASVTVTVAGPHVSAF